MPHTIDVDVSAKGVAGLTSADAVAAFLNSLGYDTGRRTTLTAEAVGLAGEAASPIKKIELLSEDPEKFLRVIFVHLKSLTAKSRNDLARVLGKANVDHLLILASDFESLEFVLLNKRKRESRGAIGIAGIQVVPMTVAVSRRAPTRLELRTIRRLTWTCRDGLEQFDKLRSVFEAAAYTEEYFQNRALFSDYYLLERLKEDPAWRGNPSMAFAKVKDLLRDGQHRWQGKGEQIVRDELYEPAFKMLGFHAAVNKATKDNVAKPDYILKDHDGKQVSAAFVYQWDRWLDGPDLNDADTPDENPGACVVSALDQGIADWIVVTNGRYWRLYSKQAHSRATNFYEVDLAEALIASGDTDPNEAFRYWLLFFQSDAFKAEQEGCWLDAVVKGSRDYAKRLGERLKDRIFVSIFPYLAQGFLLDRKGRLGLTKRPADEELNEVFAATLTLLYRLLFLLYAESRDLLPIREAPYRAASLKKMKDEIAVKAGIADSAASDQIKKAYSEDSTDFYDRLMRLCAAMDTGDPSLNVPTYNGGLFISKPDESERREQKIARFLAAHKIPDRQLALAVDRLSRDEDEKTFSLAFIDYKSLEVRHLGSIYEGLLEFKLKVAEEDLATQTEDKKEKYIPLAEAKGKKGKAVQLVVRKGEVYLSNDKAERKASGSYYTPDPIVQYIVENAVGPVLNEKLEALREEFRKVRKTYDRHLQNANSPPLKGKKSGDRDPREYAAEQTYLAHKDLVERLFDFKALDPAMGSGHFLVEAVDFITDRLLNFLNQFPVNPISFALDKIRRNILQSLTEQGVSVDPEKLTDVNLLKRHVLKRCIYGIDLNPMAVELAKVSLWLDAFTLGAPLSFLDHHLRVGNSLIGASFKDLEKATTGQLFPIDYDELRRAIDCVIQISSLTDSTAAEAKQSADEYGRARKQLSGYQVLLDLLVAKHFGFPQATFVLALGSEIDMRTRERFLTSIADPNLRATAESVEALARKPDRRFFHWELEFPEVFFGFADINQRLIKHKDEVLKGSAGFDAIVGNPPYVRQESIKDIKSFLKENYASFDSANDLYVFFQERETKNLRVGGRMGMIVANKWMRAGYGERIRTFLQKTALPLEVIDFGHSPIFPDADTFPCILIASRRVASIKPDDKTPDGEHLQACSVPRENWNDRMNLGGFVLPRRYSIPTVLLRSDGWSLENPRIQALLEKIRVSGVTLGAYCGQVPLRGILTGFNEAFVVDRSTRQELIRLDKKATEIVRPLLRGRDMDRWRPRESPAFLITIPSSENQDWPWTNARENAEKVFHKVYPSIHKHLSAHEAGLRKRQDKGRHWWELRSCDYMDVFIKPKIVWQEMAWFTRFSFDNKSHVINNTAYMLESSDAMIPAVLNSRLAWWYMWRTAQHGKDEVLRLIRDYTQEFPMPNVTSEIRGKIVAIVELLSTNAFAISELQEALTESLKKLGFVVDGTKLLRWLLLSELQFKDRIAKQIGEKRLGELQSHGIAQVQSKLRSCFVELLSEQLRLEEQASSFVEGAYGLTPEDRDLLNTTRPIRDPLDVLEKKIQGELVEDDALTE